MNCLVFAQLVLSNKLSQVILSEYASIKQAKQANFQYIFQGEVNRLSGENDKFAANNKAFEAQVSQMSGENDKLSQNNEALSGEIEKLKEQISRMAAENEKFEENNKKLKEQV